jgi:hypothetical protein
VVVVEEVVLLLDNVIIAITTIRPEINRAIKTPTNTTNFRFFLDCKYAVQLSFFLVGFTLGFALVVIKATVVLGNAFKLD